MPKGNSSQPTHGELQVNSFNLPILCSDLIETVKNAHVACRTKY
jgi:hypothetical protein